MMLMKGGGGGGVFHNFEQFAYALRKAATATEKQTPVVLRAIGVQCLSWGVRDYRTRGRKQTDETGLAWRDITRSAFVSRLAKRSPYQKNRTAREALTAREKELTKDIAKGMPRGPQGARIRAGIAWRFYEDHPELRGIQRKRKELRAQREALIAKESSQYEIGLDTGRLIGSLTFGVKELDTVKIPQAKGAQQTQPPTPAMLAVQGNAVTVGSVLEYASYFDASRPLFGPNFITPARKDRLDKMATRMFQAMADKELKEFNDDKKFWNDFNTGGSGGFSGPNPAGG